MGEFENLPGFLDHVSLVMDNTENAQGDMISIMTLHGAKGLEFDTVFLPGWEEGLFPNQRALEEKGVAALEEERRLAYVGITRSRKRVYVSFAANRRVFNQWQAAIPSRFISELPQDHIEQSSDAGLYATYSAGHHGGLREGLVRMRDIDASDAAEITAPMMQARRPRPAYNDGWMGRERLSHPFVKLRVLKTSLLV